MQNKIIYQTINYTTEKRERFEINHIVFNSLLSWNNENVIEFKITLCTRIACLLFASLSAFQKLSYLKFLSSPPRYVGWIRKILGVLKNKRIHRFRYLFRSRPLGNHTTKVSAPHFFCEIMEYWYTRFCTLTTSVAARRRSIYFTIDNVDSPPFATFTSKPYYCDRFCYLSDSCDKRLNTRNSMRQF